MKNRIFNGILALIMAVFTVACSDDDYAISNTPLLGENSVVTGSADVTPVTATLNGSVSGLDGQSASSYTVGFYYGSEADNLSETVLGNSASSFTASIGGSPSDVIYYQAFVTLQGRLTYKGAVKSLILTDAKAVTGEPADLTACTAKLSGQAVNFTSDSEVGIVISGVAGEEAVRSGVRVSGVTAETFDISAQGLLPNTTYYYTAYVDLGPGTVYGEVRSFTTPEYTFDVDNDLVDLGLSTKWARYNLGATSENELGGLFGFGDMTGYNTSIDPANYASADIYKTAQDVANKVYEGKVTMPTIDEFEELFRCCDVEWTEQEGVAGYKFTGPNGNSIFMPAAGSRTAATTNGVGVEGRYLSGSINPGDNTFAMSYLFTSAGNARSTTPVYQALSVRPVSVAKNIPFDKTLLYKTWEIDLTTEGECKTFSCPIYFYRSASNYNSVTNNEPIVGSGEDWIPGSYNDINWFVSSAEYCKGSITFNEDGTASVKRYTTDGAEISESGTYTVDEKTKTITLNGMQILAPANFKEGDNVVSLTTDLRILSITDNSLQISVSRSGDYEQLSINMIPQSEKYGYKASLTCYGDGVDGSQPDEWNSATVTVAGGQTGTYTVTFNAEAPRTNGKVFILDIVGFAEAYPNAFVKIDAIKADGKEVKFDANKFFYGDIEGNGNFRIELANIWGKGGKDNGLADTPFHEGGGATNNETALAFNSTFEVTFTIVSLDASLEFNVKQTAVGLNEDWATPGNWGKENPAAIKVVMENNQYKLATTDDVALTLTADECDNGVPPANGAVNLVDIVGIHSFFPGFSADLISVTNDGSNVPFDATKLITGDIEGKGNFRIELHNIWGAGTAANPAFGGAKSVAGNNVVTSLGFTQSSKYTIGNFSKNLFPLPW